MAINEETTEEKTQSTKWLSSIDIIFLFIIGNLVLEILVTAAAAILVNNYLVQFFRLGFITVLLIAAEIIVSMVVSAIYSEIGGRIFKWSEDKKSDHLVYSFLLLFTIFLIIISIAMYIASSTIAPLTMDPFNLGESSTYLATSFSFWWFFGFIISAIIAAILFLYIEGS